MMIMISMTNWTIAYAIYVWDLPYYSYHACQDILKAKP